MFKKSETHDYDPQFDRAQTVEGAKARYVSHDTDYNITDFERDVERILAEGEYPDRDYPVLEGLTVPH